MDVQVEFIEEACLLYAFEADPKAVERLIGARRLRLDHYTPLSDGITLSDWSEDPRLVTVNKWGEGALVSEVNGGCRGAQPETLAKIAGAGYEAVSVCWQGGTIPGWGGWRRLIAYARNGHLAVAFDPRRPSNRIGGDLAAMDAQLHGLDWAADRRHAALRLLERFAGAELLERFIRGGHKPDDFFIIEQPPQPLDDSAFRAFLEPPTTGS
ncbi:hypothetical protein [Nonomuraea zeae]|uniref:Uncharacterized protein n=1 Tax=Nonomuraea zeae TaxID=1642303 RepID=A0A5S4F5Z3_9ACTN|nr:hypothetical protein [Nonomuraea zeae]TMR11714.1 hypothetical protein ETD85_59070 [Nonomuraea zeae]